jgi:biopolymer transport protein ExbD
VGLAADFPMKAHWLSFGALALSVGLLNGCSKSPTPHQQANGQKRQSIVIAVDKDGNIYWNGEPIKQTELRARYQQALRRAQAASKGRH